jgi:hypothetical protein
VSIGSSKTPSALGRSALVVGMAPSPSGRSQALPLQVKRRAAGMNYNCSTRANPANRVAWCTIFSLRYLVAAAAVLTSQVVMSVDPEAKRSAPYYLNISWVQHIDVLHITQDEIVSGRRACWTRTWENSLHPDFSELRHGEVRRIPKRRSSQNSYSRHFGE